MVADEIKVQVVSRETVKPSSRTPKDRDVEGAVKLSLCDQLSPVLYATVLLFYPGDGADEDATMRAQREADKSQKLKSSISDVLTLYYPLAGRIRDNYSFDCNDEGAAYIEARVNYRLEELLEKPHSSVLDRMFPVSMESTEAASGLLLLVQANFFECGGLAIGIAISHKLCDGSTMASFINSWSGVARGSPDVINPDFATISSLIPPQKHLVDLPVAELPKGLCITRRYVFDSASVAALKAKANQDAGMPEPTRVEAVSAFVWKCAANASRRNLNEPSRRTVLSQAVNLRDRVTPPLPGNTIGNFLGSFTTLNNNPDAELHHLVNDLRASKNDYFKTYPQTLLLGQESATNAIFEAAGKFGSLMTDESIDFYNCSSSCNLGRPNVADFGWGNPIWMCLKSMEFKNSVVLVDAMDGESVEVWLTLKVSDMAELDYNQDLLKFASLNPSVTW